MSRCAAAMLATAFGLPAMLLLKTDKARQELAPGMRALSLREASRCCCWQKATLGQNCRPCTAAAV